MGGFRGIPSMWYSEGLGILEEPECQRHQPYIRWFVAAGRDLLCDQRPHEIRLGGLDDVQLRRQYTVHRRDHFYLLKDNKQAAVS